MFVGELQLLAKPPSWMDDDSAEELQCIRPVCNRAIGSSPSSSAPLEQQVAAEYRGPCKTRLQVSDQMQELSCMLFELELQFQISRDPAFLPEADRLAKAHSGCSQCYSDVVCTIRGPFG